MTLAELFEMVGGDTTFNVYSYDEHEYLATFDGKNGISTISEREVCSFEPTSKNELKVYIDMPGFDDKARELRAKGLPVVRKNGDWYTLKKIDYNDLLMLEEEYIIYGEV